MRLHSPTFSRAFDRLLRAERRASPALRRAMRRTRRSRTRRSAVSGCLWRAFWSVVLAVMLLSLSQDERGGAVATALAAWWFLQVCVLGRGVVRVTAADLPPALLPLPFTPDAYQRLARHRVLGLLWRPFLDALAVLGVLAFTHHAGPSGWLLVVPLAALCALSVWSASLWLAQVEMPRIIPTVLILLPVALFIAFVSDAYWVIELMNRYLPEQSPWMTLLSPGGWLSAAFLAVLGERSAAWLLAIVPALVLAWLAGRGLTGLVRTLDPETALRQEWLAAMVRTPTGVDPDEDNETAAAPVPETTGAAEAGVARAWRASVLDGAENAGWMERLFLRWLNARDRLVLECIVSRIPAWTRTTVWAARFLLFSILAAWLGRHAPVGLRGPCAAAAALSAFIGLTAGLPLASGFDQMTRRVTVYGLAVARPALYPLGVTEFLRLTLKAAAIRSLAMVPMLTGMGVALALVTGKSVFGLALLGLRLALLGWAATPVLCVLALSAVSSDSRTPGWRGVRVLGLMGVGALALLALGGGAVFAPRLWCWGCLAGFAVLSYAVARLYAHGYDRGRFDLVQRVAG